MLTKEKRAEIIKTYGKDAKDTGKTQVQIAQFTQRIKHLTEHLKQNKKDTVTHRALTLMVGKRRSLLDYLKNKDLEGYRKLIKELELRK